MGIDGASPVVSLEQDMKVNGLFGCEAMAYTSAEWSEEQSRAEQNRTIRCDMMNREDQMTTPLQIRSLVRFA